MPGFFQALVRIAKGEPVYQPTENTGIIHAGDNKDQPNENGQPEHAADTTDGRKIMPEVRVDDVKCHVSGDRLECYAVIDNQSPYDILLTDAFVLNQKRSLGGALRAGEKNDFLVYSGNVPTHENYHDAEIQFRDNAGDYFSALHDVFFERDGDDIVIRRLQYSGLKDM